MYQVWHFLSFISEAFMYMGFESLQYLIEWKWRAYFVFFMHNNSFTSVCTNSYIFFLFQRHLCTGFESLQYLIEWKWRAYTYLSLSMDLHRKSSKSKSFKSTLRRSWGLFIFIFKILFVYFFLFDWYLVQRYTYRVLQTIQ